MDRCKLWSYMIYMGGKLQSQEAGKTKKGPDKQADMEDRLIS